MLSSSIQTVSESTMCACKVNTSRAFSLPSTAMEGISAYLSVVILVMDLHAYRLVAKWARERLDLLPLLKDVRRHDVCDRLASTGFFLLPWQQTRDFLVSQPSPHFTLHSQKVEWSIQRARKAGSSARICLTPPSRTWPLGRQGQLNSPGMTFFWLALDDVVYRCDLCLGQQCTSNSRYFL